MVTRLSQTEVRQMRRPQESSMQDECVHMPRTTARDPRTNATARDPRTNATVPAWADSAGPPLACGFDPGASKDVRISLTGRTSSQENAIATDARLRLSLEDAESIRVGDKVRITSVKGRTLAAPQTFSVAGYPEMGPTGAVLNLSRVEV